MKRKNFGQILVLGVLAVTLPMFAWAQSSTPSPALEAAPAVASTMPETNLGKPTEVLNIQVNEGQIVKLPGRISSIFVANPAIADVQVKSTQLLYIFGLTSGETTLFAVDDRDNVVFSRKIQVGLNLDRLRTALSQLMGGNKVKVTSVDDMIVLSGSVDSASEAQDATMLAARYLPTGATASNQIINRLAVMGPNQVNLRVRIAEVSREAVKTLGVGTDVSNPNLFGDVGFSFGFDPSVSLTGAAATGGLSTAWGATSLSTTLTALVDDGLATILAEPNLTALSGETANFLAGGEFPIIIPDQDGGVSVEFREYGVRLSFTPTIVSKDRISLRVRPEVSERNDAQAITLAGSTIPALNTRRTETTVELGSGQSFAIAGLLQNNNSQTIEKYPGLGDLPILGALFRSDRFRQNQSELVIVVTPYLVRPTSADNIQLPTDGYVPPNDVDRWLNGRLTSEVPTAAPVHVAKPGTNAESAGLVGDVGFTLK